MKIYPLNHKGKGPAVFILLAGLLLACVAEAQVSGGTDLAALPEYALPFEVTTHHMLRLTEGKGKAVRLDAPGKKAVADDSARLDVYMPDARTVYLLGRKEGIALLTVTDKDGKTVMARHVAVVPARAPRYLRAKIICGDNTREASCGRQVFYYCTGECFETHIAGMEQR